MSAENPGLSALPLPKRVDPAPRAAPGGRLFRKYVLFFVGLVAVALLVNGGFDFWFGYQENKATLIRIQQEKANTAAQRIQGFVEEIERQIGWTTHAQWSAAPLDQRRFDYVRLLSQVPAITEISELDRDGKEQLKVSRLAMDVVGSGQDLSQTPAFTEARAHKVWFSPVYFRKESEPYMTLAMARAGRNAGVTVAEVNLKLIWDVIIAMKMGQGGYAYVVDGRGKLIAHPDISLVLRDTDFVHLPQVAGALTQDAAPSVSVARSNSGEAVLSAHAVIQPLGWLVFIEVPLREAFAPLYGAALRSALLLAFGLAGATLAAMFLARRMTVPIRAMQEGAAQIGAGELDRRLDIHTGDELETLAEQFNRMAEGLQTSYAELEHKVEERTAELSESLDQQTATAEVLGVINSSPGDLTPVFDAMLEKALALCRAPFGVLFRYDGLSMHLAATRGVSFDKAEWFHKWVPQPNGSVGEMLRGADVVHIADLTDTDLYRAGVPERVKTVEVTGARTMLWIALRKDTGLLGTFVIYRREVRPFTDKQIALLQNFAAQAVIAIENARLITETQEALDQQTATADVLGVINASPGDLTPVWEVMVEKATRLCKADSGHLALPDGDDVRTVAVCAMSPEMEAQIRAMSYAPGRGTAVGRSLLERRAVQIDDIGADPEHAARDAAAKGLIRTILGVPLLRDGEPIGAFGLSRSRVEPFTERQIELVRTFAQQAVIAIENARLINETREALDQQTATAEVLGVINASPGDLAPVFDAMLDKAMRLSEARFGALCLFEGRHYSAVAVRGLPTALAELVARPVEVLSTTITGRLLFGGEEIAHVADISALSPEFRNPSLLAMIEGGARTALWISLRKEGAALGFLVFYREEVRLFSDKQVALLQNFAAQAVIAIENARLLGEIKQRQVELRVTFDNMADGVVMFDAELRLAAWNKNFQELVELPDEFLAEPHSFEDYIRYLAARGEFGEIDPEAELARLSAQFGDQYSFNRTRPDGTVIEVRHNPMPEGGFVLIYSDITERRRSEEEIRKARDAAEAALRDLKTAQASLIQAEKMASLGQLTAGIAHEIKNPLNFVNNFASLSNELLAELREAAAPAIELLGENQREEIDETIAMLTGNLERIAEHGKRADNIVKSMLEHSRGVSGERRTVDLNALVEESLNLAYHGARAQDQTFNITLERDFDHTLQPIEVVPQDMTRVFLNLFGNGFYAANKRAHGDGGNGDAGFRPVLHVTTRDEGKAVEIRVRDNGIGIPAEIRDKLFQPFFTTKPTGEGTGLGLSISYDIVTQQHGGTIAVDSEVGAFTEFTIRLPRGQTPAARASL